VARLQVRVADAEVVALLSEATWRARFGPGDSDATFRELLLANQGLIASAVIRKATPSSRTNVVLRPDDLV
jgi:hypothetical protein